MISGNALGQVYWLDGDLGTHHEYISGELLKRAEVDLMVSKNGDGALEINSARGKALVESGSGYRYLPQSGDPLGYGAIDRPLSRRQALEATFESEYPDAMVQLDQLFSSPRCGDMVVISKNGYDLRKAFEWPEHHASHGSICRDHMIVPLIYNRKGWARSPARTTDLFNTVLKWSGKATLADTDGESLI